MELVGERAGLDGFAYDDAAQKRRTSHVASPFAYYVVQYTRRFEEMQESTGFGTRDRSFRMITVASTSA